MWPSLVQALSPPCDLPPNSFSERSLNLCWCSGKAPVCSGRGGVSPPASREHLGRSWRHIGPVGAVKKSASSLPLASRVGGHLEQARAAQPAWGIPDVFVSSLVSGLFKVKK